MWVLVRRSSLANSECKKTLGCALLIPVVTRWNSKFDAIERSCRSDVRPKMNTLIQKLKIDIKSARNLEMLTTNDWTILDEYLKIMRPVAHALDKLQGEKNCSQGYILPTIFAMKHHISNQFGRQITAEFKRTMLLAIDERFVKYFEFSERNRELILAALTLPRFKNTFIASDEDDRIAKNMLISECSRLSGDSNSNDDMNIATTEEDDFYISFSDRPIRRNSVENQVESEVLRYFSDDRKNEMILDEYPLIRNAFFRYNTTLAASGAVERLFSQSLMIFTPRRNRISSENFERALLYKLNRKVHDEESDNE